MAAIRFAIFCSVFILSVSLSYADSCQTNIPGHYPDRFTDNNDGTVNDKMTGLMWSKCIMGMSWNGSTCVGPFKNNFETSVEPLNWQDALKAARNTVYAEYSDWRVPNIKELSSLFDVACLSNAHAYAMDLDAFNADTNSNPSHDSMATSIWSSTPFREVALDAYDIPHNQAWQVNFRIGPVFGVRPTVIEPYDTKDLTTSLQRSHTRLVRGISQ